MGYYSTTDPKNSTKVNRHYFVSDELIKILSKLPKKELNNAVIVCKHHYHTESDKILAIDTKNNEIITNVTKHQENYIAALPLQKMLFIMLKMYLT